jgi:hypothetical protein
MNLLLYAAAYLLWLWVAQALTADDTRVWASEIYLGYTEELP